MSLEEGKYEGEMLDGLRHGKGELVWSNGDKYSGDFELGTKNTRTAN
jgi:hypothetical protein